MSLDLEAIRSSYARDGFVVVPAVYAREEIFRLRAHADALIARREPRFVQAAYDQRGAVKMVKVSQLSERDAEFRRLAQHPALVDVVEALVGPGARRFRDVLVVKPARTGGSLSYHQDSAYWDVEPKELVSSWIPLGDVAADASCLRVIPATHHDLAPHGLYLRGRHAVPKPVVATLRKLVSLAGTGDNPEGTSGSMVAWKLKQLVLARATRYAPALFDLQDYRIAPDATLRREERLLPLRAGDVVFFHSLLWHASGPNTTAADRYAEIVSFTSADSRVAGRSRGDLPAARGAR